MKIIFDLSEVLISGLIGIEETISKEYCIPEDTILPIFGNENLKNICIGNISEDEYLNNILKITHWEIPVDELKRIIRSNFKNRLDDSIKIFEKINDNYFTILFSDHAREWIEFIEKEHSFMHKFDKKVYSFQLNSIKSEKDSFKKLLTIINTDPGDCLFIDDNIKNIGVAKESGINAIHFSTSKELKSQLKKIGIL